MPRPLAPRWMWPCTLLLLLAQGTALVHLATASHGVCWEHGVVVELEGPADAALARVDAPAGAPGLDRASAATLRAEAHPHCASLWLRRELRTSVAPVAPLPRGRVPGSADAAPPARSTSAPPLAFAPKQSPPSAAGFQGPALAAGPRDSRRT